MNTYSGIPKYLNLSIYYLELVSLENDTETSNKYMKYIYYYQGVFKTNVIVYFIYVLGREFCIGLTRTLLSTSPTSPL